MTKKKREVILILVLLLAAAAGFLVNQTMHKKPAAQVEITVDGKLVQTLDLNKNADLIIDGVNGGSFSGSFRVGICITKPSSYGYNLKYFRYPVCHTIYP